MIFENSTCGFNSQVGVERGCGGFSSQPACGIPEDFALLFILSILHLGSCTEFLLVE